MYRFVFFWGGFFWERRRKKRVKEREGWVAFGGKILHVDMNEQRSIWKYMYEYDRLSRCCKDTYLPFT